jgi:hypothetical protein
VAWMNLGKVLTARAQGLQRDNAVTYLNEAIGCFRQVLRLSPGNDEARRRLADCERTRDAVRLMPADARYGR